MTIINSFVSLNKPVRKRKLFFIFKNKDTLYFYRRKNFCQCLYKVNTRLKHFKVHLFLPITKYAHFLMRLFLFNVFCSNFTKHLIKTFIPPQIHIYIYMHIKGKILNLRSHFISRPLLVHSTFLFIFFLQHITSFSLIALSL